MNKKLLVFVWIKLREKIVRRSDPCDVYSNPHAHKDAFSQNSLNSTDHHGEVRARSSWILTLILNVTVEYHYLEFRGEVSGEKPYFPTE